jgi:hypothetical protein
LSQSDADAGRLASVKLRAIAPTLGFDASTADERDFAYGAGLVSGTRGALYVTREHIRSIGPTLLWMLKHQLTEIDLVIEGDGGIPARRAQALTCGLRVWQLQNGKLERAQPTPHLPKVEVPQSHEQFAATIQNCGALPVREHGVLTGEVLGLEVCRVVDTQDGPRLEVGVGAIDRETFQLVNSHRTIEDSLTEVVGIVRAHRSPGAPHHPLGKMAGERLLRHRVINEPSLIGAATLKPAEPPIPRGGMRETTPCVATGTDLDGNPIVVVLTDTVDVDIIGFGVDALTREGPNATLLVITFAGNVTSAMRQVASEVLRQLAPIELPRT